MGRDFSAASTALSALLKEKQEVEKVFWDGLFSMHVSARVVKLNGLKMQAFTVQPSNQANSLFTTHLTHLQEFYTSIKIPIT